MINAVLLVIATIIWGMGFIATKWTMMEYDPLWANTLRYLLAGTLSIPIFIWKKSFCKSLKELHFKALTASFFLFMSMQLQTYGLKYTSVAKNGFLTTFYAFFTPLVAMIIFKKRFRKGFWGLVGLAMFGIFMLCNMELTNINKGDLLTLGCAFFAAFHIIYLGKNAESFRSAIEFNSLQCFYVGLMGLVLSLIVEGPVDLSSALDFGALGTAAPITGFFFAAILSSLIAFSIQVHSQKYIPMHIVSLIFLLESPFAAFFGYIFLGESLSIMNIAGCAIVVLSVGLIPLYLREKKVPDNHLGDIVEHDLEIHGELKK